MYAQDNNSLPVWIILSPAHHHISINSQPFLVGIVSQVIMGRNSLVPDVYPMTSGNHFVDTLESNLINDSVQIEIPKQVMDVLRTCSISKWTSEPYHQNLRLVEWNYRTIKLWTNSVNDKSDASSNYWLLCIIHVCYLLNHIACSNDSKIPVHRLAGGECGSPTGPSKLKLKTISTRFPSGFFRSRCD